MTSHQRCVGSFVAIATLQFWLGCAPSGVVEAARTSLPGGHALVITRRPAHEYPAGYVREARVLRRDGTLMADSLVIDTGGNSRLELGELEPGRFLLWGFPQAYVVDLHQRRLVLVDADTAPAVRRPLGVFDADSMGRWNFRPAGVLPR